MLTPCALCPVTVSSQVFLQRSFATECPIALFTLETVPGCVAVHVELQSALPGRPESTYGTRKRLLARMNAAKMDVKVTSLQESARAHVAVVRSVSGVRAHVAVPRPAVSEFSTTRVTLVWFLASVDHHMTSQTVLLFEVSVTGAAVEGLGGKWHFYTFPNSSIKTKRPPQQLVKNSHVANS